jgi:hypothetical protein
MHNNLNIIFYIAYNYFDSYFSNVINLMYIYIISHKFTSLKISFCNFIKHLSNLLNLLKK